MTMWTRRAGRVWFAALVAALILSMSLTANVRAQGATPEATPLPYTPGTDLGSLSGKIVADGSSTVGPITSAVAEEFGKEASGVEISVDISGTGGGFKRFCAGETDVQDASRPITDDEIKTCQDGKVNYYVFEVAYDGITVVVNPENTFVECLKVDELKQLWQPDSTVKTWQDLNPDYPADTIDLYGPGTDSGTFDYFTEQIVGTQGSSRTDYTPSEDDNVLVEGVAGDANALGYFGYAYYFENQDKLKAVAVDGGDGCVLPSKDTIRDGTYKPLSRPLFVYVKKESLARPEVQEFIRYYLANARQLVDDVGYVDAPNDNYVSDQAKLEGAIAGTTEPDGPGAAS
jgi:phosphate transport system substrate-binding protein